ncbi:hypothetical protein MNBD_PLANCTO03-1446, partial [hydrothermal vent metagenome]
MKVPCILVLSLLVILSARISGQEESPAQPRPYELSLQERAAYYTDEQRWPSFQHAGLELTFRALEAKIKLGSRLATNPESSLGMWGAVRWTPEAGDLIVGRVAIIHRAEDQAGRSLLRRPRLSRPLASHNLRWNIHQSRDRPSFSFRTDVSVGFNQLGYLPATIKVFEGEFPVWRSLGATLTRVPFETTTAPIELAPEVEASVVLGKDERGRTIADVVIVQPEPGEIGPLHLPRVLRPESSDFVTASGDLVRDIGWDTPPPAPDAERAAAEAGKKLIRWRFVQAREKDWPVGVGIRVRVVQNVYYDPIPFVLRDIPVLEEPPLPQGAVVPRRTSTRGPFSLSFLDPSGPGRREGVTVTREGAFLRLGVSLAIEADTPAFGVADAPILREAQDSSGVPFEVSPYQPAILFWTDGIRFYPQHKRTGRTTLSARFAVDPGIRGIDTMRGTWPIWIVESSTEHVIPLEVIRDPISLSPEVGLSIR